ncbi:XK-related protein 8-like [Arapaima gigas]
MQCSAAPCYSLLDLLFTAIGAFTYLLDAGTDMWVASRFFLLGDIFWFGLWVASMVASSVLLQAFSWLWLCYDRDLEERDQNGDHEQNREQQDQDPEQEFRACGEDVLLGAGRVSSLSCVLHVLQLGFLFRHISALWQGALVWCGRARCSEFAIFLNHDLSMLRLIETFCESAPQLTLATYVMLRTNKAELFQGLGAAISMLSMAWMVVDYHRSLRSYLPEKAQQAWGSSVIYFVWNLLLMGPRVCSLAMFASTLPTCLPLHFVLLWPPLVLWAALQKTAFMESVSGEWLYRAVVGLIWYFSWFNVSEGHTGGRALLYHLFMTADGAILVSTWWCYRDPEETQLYAPWLVAVLLLSTLLGLLLKLLYYQRFHPMLMPPPAAGEDQPDRPIPTRSFSVQASFLRQSRNKRMAQHVSCFYVPQWAVRKNGEELGHGG